MDLVINHTSSIVPTKEHKEWYVENGDVKDLGAGLMGNMLLGILLSLLNSSDRDYGIIY